MASFSFPGFHVIHLNQTSNIIIGMSLTEKELSEYNTKESFCFSNDILLDFDGIQDLISKYTTPKYELRTMVSDPLGLQSVDKTIISVKNDGVNYEFTSFYEMFLPPKKKIEIKRIISKNIFDTKFKETMQDIVKLQEFYRSNIDWTKNETEKKKSNDLGKKIEKIKKLISKI